MFYVPSNLWKWVVMTRVALLAQLSSQKEWQVKRVSNEWTYIKYIKVFDQRYYHIPVTNTYTPNFTDPIKIHKL